jgi:hypothetical protein
VFQRIGFDWDNPLSADRFSAWRESIPDKHDQIFVSRYSLTLRTTPLAGEGNEVDYASLTVNRSDWRPVSEHIEFRNQPALDVAELSYEVRLLLPTVPATEPANSTDTKPANTAAVEPDVNLFETELAVRYALHRLGADLGESIDIRTSTSRPESVSVIGIVSSGGRKQELLAALSSIPHVVAQLQTEGDSGLVDLPPLVTRAEPLIVTVRSPIEKELLDYFGDASAVETFSKRAAGVTEDLMGRAWALRHLSERYGTAGATDEPPLSPSSRELLKAMRQDHYRAMSNTTADLTALLRPLLLSIIRDNPQPTTTEALFDIVQKVQRLTLDLISGSGSPTGNNVDPASTAQDLLSALRALNIALEEHP